MSWLKPSDFEKELVSNYQESYPELIKLAQLTCLARIVEPTLLRNLRTRFMPASESELEAHLWFSPLVSSFSSRSFVLHHGVARLLAEDLISLDCWLASDINSLLDIDNVDDRSLTKLRELLWNITQQYTQDWTELDKLEQAFRYYSLTGDQEKIQLGVRQVLAEISHTVDEKRQLELARWGKRVLPAVGSSGGLQEMFWLAQYSSQALGSTANWTKLVRQEKLPVWLSRGLPSVPLGKNGGFNFKVGLRLYLEVRKNYSVLEFCKAENGIPALPLPHSLPARVSVETEAENTSYVIDERTRVRLNGISGLIRLITIDGKRFELRVDQQSDFGQVGLEEERELYISYVAEDKKKAQSIANWFEGHDINVRLIEDQPEIQNQIQHTNHSVVLRLWTDIARKKWETSSVLANNNPLSCNILLRTEPTAAPLGFNPAKIIDLADWTKEESTEQINKILELVTNLENEQFDTGEGVDINKNEYEEDIPKLLKSLDDPTLSKKGRLAIGDRLNLLQDPRLGLGVKEQKVNLPSTYPRVLIDTHQKDQRGAFRLADALADRGIDVHFNKESNDPVKSSENFEFALGEVEHLIIVFGSVDPKWVDSRMRTAIKFFAEQMQHSAPTLVGIYVYLFPKSTGIDDLSRIPRIPELLNTGIFDNSGSEAIDELTVNELMEKFSQVY